MNPLGHALHSLRLLFCLLRSLLAYCRRLIVEQNEPGKLT